MREDSGEKKKSPGRARQAKLVGELLEKVEHKLGEGDVKATLGDYIRLVQLQKELEEEEPRDIKVTWVDPETETRPE